MDFRRQQHTLVFHLGALALWHASHQSLRAHWKLMNRFLARFSPNVHMGLLGDL